MGLYSAVQQPYRRPQHYLAPRPLFDLEPIGAELKVCNHLQLGLGMPLNVLVQIVIDSIKILRKFL